MTFGVERAPGYLVKRVQLALRRRCDTALRSTGVSMAQYAVLRALADHPEASASELARLCFVTRQSLQDVLSALRDGELVEPTGAPPRGRTKALRLTTAGVRQLRACATAIESVESVMEDGISKPEREQLADLLIRCAENLEDSAPA
ncbi:MAG: MarR family winged helix-turn-helix transcriptional regulator [Mycobacterium sp.]